MPPTPLEAFCFVVGGLFFWGSGAFCWGSGGLFGVSRWALPHTPAPLWGLGVLSFPRWLAGFSWESQHPQQTCPLACWLQFNR